MIVLVNGDGGEPAAPREAVAGALARRFASAPCRAIAVAEAEPEPLAALRGRLAAEDPETHAIWLDPDGRGLPPGADRGDVGLLVGAEPGAAPDAVAGRIGSLVRDEIVLVPPDPAWSRAFAGRRASLAAALDGLATSIHHVGSTALPDVPAKPILDVAVGVARLDDARAAIVPLRRLGFAFVDYPQNVDRRFFRTVPLRTCQLHVVEEAGPVLADLLRFRDALRASPELRRRLSELKTSLAARHGGDRVAYGEGKSAFVREVLARA